MIELKPCPFCAGKSNVKSQTFQDGKYARGETWVECDRCHARTRKYEYKFFYATPFKNINHHIYEKQIRSAMDRIAIEWNKRE